MPVPRLDWSSLVTNSLAASQATRQLLTRQLLQTTPPLRHNPPPSSFMSRHDDDGMSSDRLFRFPKPQWLTSANTRNAGVYLAGALFCLALFVLIDASVYSNSHLNGSELHLNFVDWIPAIFSFLGMLVINSIDKSRLSGDTWAYSGDGVAWKARVVLFMGFAAMAGGLAGGVTVMVLKYITQQANGMSLWFGVSNLVANALVMLSSIVLWVSQNMEDDYTYNLAL